MYCFSLGPGLASPDVLFINPKIATTTMITFCVINGVGAIEQRAQQAVGVGSCFTRAICYSLKWNSVTDSYDLQCLTQSGCGLK